MKNYRLIIALLFVFQIVTVNQLQLSAQKIKTTDVPEDVIQTFDEQYSYMKVGGWQIENGNYVASVKDGSTSGKVYISKSGEWLKTTFNVPPRELPSAITDFVANNYPDFIISESCLEEKENESTHYYLEVKKDGIGNRPSILTFATTGSNKLLSRNDPDDFVDPTKQQPDKIAQAKAAAEERSAAKAEAAKKAAEEKAAQDKAKAEAAKKSLNLPHKLRRNLLQLRLLIVKKQKNLRKKNPNLWLRTNMEMWQSKLPLCQMSCLKPW